MHVELALLIFFIARYMRKTLETAAHSPQLDRLLVIAMGMSLAILGIQIFVPGSRKIGNWLAYAMFGVFIYETYKRPILKSIKPMMFAIVPLVIVSVVTDLVKLISSDFYFNWESYFNTAHVVAIVWVIGMIWTTQRQKKALAKERQKTIEKEKEYKITASLKAELEVQVAERTAALTKQTEELQHTITELKATQVQLIQSEKMASLGELTAGIAHEIQNPLNFVNNFSEINSELIAEMKEEIAKGNLEEVKAIANDIAENEQKINHHGKRADAIVKGMLQHSRNSSGVKEPTDINALADEYLRLAYHGLRARDKSFNAHMKTNFDPGLSADKDGNGKINIVPQDIGRVVLNLITNAFYAVAEKKKLFKPAEGTAAYEPTVTVSTRKIDFSARSKGVEIKVEDNGNGIPQAALDKIFQPFFTTKPTGEGTGLGLSMSYDIITKGHGGNVKVENKEGEGASFIIQIPLQQNNI